jgi:molybdopterin-biosynthesis enzyme MoeA-like protein
VPTNSRHSHDDITYQSIAKAFRLPLTLHDESLQRMIRMHRQSFRQPNFDWTTPSDALTARKRMVELPLDQHRPLEDQVVFTSDDLWVPLNIVNGNVHILPGVPRLFTSMLEGYKPMLRPKLADPSGKGDYRIIIETPLPESAVAGYLTRLQKAVDHKGVKVGSYPRWGSKRNTVTLVGKDREFMDGLVADVVKEVEGKRIEKDLPADSDTEMS